MRSTLRRKLAVGLAGAVMTALSVVAVMPAGATNPATPAVIDQLPIVTAVPTNDAGAPIAVAPAYIITGYGAPAATSETDPDDRSTGTADTGANGGGDNGGSYNDSGETVHTVPADQG